jgi:hypothetical protein
MGQHFPPLPRLARYCFLYFDEATNGRIRLPESCGLAGFDDVTLLS